MDDAAVVCPFCHLVWHHHRCNHVDSTRGTAGNHTFLGHCLVLAAPILHVANLGYCMHGLWLDIMVVMACWAMGLGTSILGGIYA